MKKLIRSALARAISHHQLNGGGRFSRGFLGLMLVLVVGSSSLFASKLSQGLEQALMAPQPDIFVLVYMKSRAELDDRLEFESRGDRIGYVYESLTRHARETQADLVDFLEAIDADYRSFYITNMIALYNPTRNLILEIAARSDVDRLSLDPNYSKERIIRDTTPALVELSSVGRIESSLSSIGADRVWNEIGVKGEGIVVASQDTGVQWDHPALIEKYRGYKNAMQVDHDYSWHDAIHRRNNHRSVNKCGYGTKAPCDDGEHGTHTVGTILGSALKPTLFGFGEPEMQSIGVAPDAKWIACRNMDDGDGRPSTYIDCFEYFLAPYPAGGDPFTDGRPELAPHVISNSWGCPSSEGCDGFEMEEVFSVMKQAGIMLVVSAGNDGPGCGTIDSQPSSHQGSVFTVGALNHRFETIASFSSRGPSAWDNLVGPSIVAPGVSIRSSIPKDKYAGGWSGTSMASPHVVGLVALMWSARPDLIGKIDETIEYIQQTAKPIEARENCGGTPGSEIPNNTYGYGVIDAYAAVTEILKD